MSEPKPGDLFLGVSELFGILLPGAALLYLVQPWMHELVPRALLPGGAAQSWIVFGVLAYFLGHLLHTLGAMLDRLFDEYYLPWRQPEHRAAVERRKQGLSRLKEDREASATLVGQAYLAAGESKPATSFYDWCLSLARLKSALAAAEIDRYQADSKFFRSLFLVLLLAAAILVWQDSAALASFAALGAAFCMQRYCKLRWNAMQRAYEYFLLFHLYPDPGKR